MPDGDSFYLKLRFHLPIKTNDKCFGILNGYWYNMNVGGIYFFNNGLPHAARNDSEEERIHLVWDIEYSEEVLNAKGIQVVNWAKHEEMKEDYPNDGDYGVKLSTFKVVR